MLKYKQFQVTLTWLDIPVQCRVKDEQCHYDYGLCYLNIESSEILSEMFKGVSQESGVRAQEYFIYNNIKNIASNNDGDTTQEATQRYKEIDTSLKRNNNLEWC